MTDLPFESACFREAVQRMWERMSPCIMCPRRCMVDRLAGRVGYCGIGAVARISSAGPHFGEESVLVGSGGSGTIFFAGCNLRCIFCQNFDISHHLHGQEMSVGDLAACMLDLQRTGCSNINVVTPSHVAAPIITGIESARHSGLKLPIVYNCGGYESIETLKLLEGYVDIYMPDMKYSNNTSAEKLSGAIDYWDVNRAAVKEMHRQVGDLMVENGIARRGLLVRHLVLPNRLAGSFEIIDFLSEKVSKETAINVMNQYRPCFKADSYAECNRRPAAHEVDEVRSYAVKKGLNVLSG
ncbi:MAG: radical SAM protein [Planctomycetota bacterium]